MSDTDPFIPHLLSLILFHPVHPVYFFAKSYHLIAPMLKLTLERSNAAGSSAGQVVGHGAQ